MWTLSDAEPDLPDGLVAHIERSLLGEGIVFGDDVSIAETPRGHSVRGTCTILDIECRGELRYAVEGSSAALFLAARPRTESPPTFGDFLPLPNPEGEIVIDERFRPVRESDALYLHDMALSSPEGSAGDTGFDASPLWTYHGSVGASAPSVLPSDTTADADEAADWMREFGVEGDDLDDGFSMWGRVALHPLIDEAAEFVGFDAHRTAIFRARITEPADRPAPVLEVGLPLGTSSGGGFSIGALKLRSPVLAVSTSLFLPAVPSAVLIRATLEIDDRTRLEIEAGIDTGDTVFAAATLAANSKPVVDLDSLGIDASRVSARIDVAFSLAAKKLTRIGFAGRVENAVILETPRLEIVEAELGVVVIDPFGRRFQLVDLDGTVRIGRLELNGAASFPGGPLRLSLRTEPGITLREVVTELGAGAAASAIPENLELSELGLEYHPGPGVFVGRLALGGDFEIVPGLDFLKLSNLELGVVHASGTSVDLAAVLSFPTLDLTLAVEASHDPDEGWSFRGAVGGEIPLGDIIADLARMFGGADFTLPPALADAVITQLEVAFAKHPEKSASFTFRCVGRLGTGIDGSARSSEEAPTLDVEVRVGPSHDGGHEARFSGRLLFGAPEKPVEIDLVFEKSSEDGEGRTLLLGAYSSKGAEAVSLVELARHLSPRVATALSGIGDRVALEVNSALIVFSRDGSGDDSRSGFLLTADIDLGFDLSGLGDLPLVGDRFSDDSALEVSFQPIISSEGEDGTPEFDEVTLGRIRELAPEGAPTIPQKLDSAVQIIATLDLAGELLPLPFEVKPSSEPRADGGSGDPGPPAPAPSEAVASAPLDVKWIDLQRSFGPLHLERVGAAFDGEAQRIAVLIDATISVGPIELALEGLGASYSLETRDLAFTLDGLGIDFRQGPLEIGGIFMRLGEDEFAGKVILRAGTLGLTALGMFTQIREAGHKYPSLFIYAFLDYPLGGPGFFFVEGLAAGFGLNRDLTVPPIEEIHEFPLVTEVMGASQPAKVGGDSPFTGIREEFEKLRKYIAPEVGQYFLAVGVKFNSFKIVDCFALVALSFGKRLEIDVFGVARLSMPSESPEVIAFVEMEFSARLLPEEGSLLVQAQLTPNSYILSESCHLQGGFAFAVWMKGEHAGDFVYTFGGYHPNFHVPDHYPRVPRLGFNWEIDANTHVKGEAYAALTSSAIMAGGRFEAAWHSGHAKAWFVMGADFLIGWKPFHYEARLFLSVGAEYTLHFFGTHHLSFHASVDLSIWGPEFSGRGEVSVSVLGFDVDFSVSFEQGSESKPVKIPWSEFQTSFLPTTEADDGNVPDFAGYCTVVATAGLVKSVEIAPSVELLVMNAKELRITTDSVIPLSREGLVDVSGTTEDDWISTGLVDPLVLTGTRPGRSSALAPVAGAVRSHGIEPVGLGRSEHVSLLIVRVLSGHHGLDEEEGKNVSRDFNLTPISKRVPRSLWSEGASATSRPEASAEFLFAVTGYALTPAEAARPGASHFVRDESLQFDVAPRDLPPEAPARPGWGLLEDGAASSPRERRRQRRRLLRESARPGAEADALATRRAALVAALGFDADEAIELDPLLADAFVTAPRIGEFFVRPSEEQA